MNAEELNALGVEPEQIDKGAFRIRLTSNSQSLSILSRLAKEYSIHPRIRSLVAELLAPCKEKDYDCYINRITSFVKENIKYVNDPPRAEVFQSPLKTLEWGIGDCDDFAVLTASLLLSAGLNARPVIRRVNDRWGHVVVAVFHPERKKWVEIDTTKTEEKMVTELGLVRERRRRYRSLLERAYRYYRDANEGKVHIASASVNSSQKGFQILPEVFVFNKLKRPRAYSNNPNPRIPPPLIPIKHKDEYHILPVLRKQYKQHGQNKRTAQIKKTNITYHQQVKPQSQYVEAGFLSKKTLPILFGLGAIIYLLKK